MALSRTGKLLQYVNYRMRVTLTDGRQICGRQVQGTSRLSPAITAAVVLFALNCIAALCRFMAYDRHMNLVLGDSEEFRKLPPKKGKSDEEVCVVHRSSSMQQHFSSRAVHRFCFSWCCACVSKAVTSPVKLVITCGQGMCWQSLHVY